MTISKKFDRMKKDHVVALQVGETKFNGRLIGYAEAYKKLPEANRNTPQTDTFQNAVNDIFNIAYFTIGLDILGKKYKDLTETQKDWLAERLIALQENLLGFHRQMTMLALHTNNIQLEGIPQNIQQLPKDQQEMNYQKAIKDLEKNDRAKLIIENLKDSWKKTAKTISEICPEVDAKLEPGNEAQEVQGQAYNQRLLMASSSSYSSGFSSMDSSLLDNLFFSHHCHHNPFAWTAGWLDGGNNSVNGWAYWGSSSYQSGVIDRQLIECCGQICCGNDGCITKCCHSCGQINCHCPDLSCPSCGSCDCHCDSNCCSGCDCKCDRCECDANCCGVSITIGGGGCITVGKAVSGDDAKPNDNPQPQPTPPPGPMNVTMTDSLMNSLEENKYRLIAAAEGTAVSSSSATIPHTQFISSTVGKLAAGGTFLLLASGHMLRATFTPVSNLLCCYKPGRSAVQLVAGYGMGGVAAYLANSFQDGGPHSAIVAGGTALVTGYYGSKAIIHSYARKQNNGISNPAKWMLTSDVLQMFEKDGHPPEKIAMIIQKLREFKYQGRTLSNNRFYGAMRLIRMLGYLADCCKNDMEVQPDRIMTLLQKNDPEAFSQLTNAFPRLAIFGQPQQSGDVESQLNVNASTSSISSGKIFTGSPERSQMK